MKTKVCTKCGVEKAVSEFYKSKQEKDGHRYDCKICTKRFYKNMKVCKTNVDIIPLFKACTKCKTLKPLNEYNINKLSRDGKSCLCRSCTKIKNRENRPPNICRVKNTEEYKIYFKACSKCRTLKSIKEYQIDKCKGETYKSYCSECGRAYTKIYVNNNKEMVLVKSKTKKKEQRDNLEDQYIKQRLKKIKHKNKDIRLSINDIPSELIELKRTIMLIRREIKARRTA